MRRFLAVALLLAGVSSGCDFEPTEATVSSQGSEAQFGKKSSTSSRVPHTIQFSQDIGSGPVTVSTASSNPFANLVSPATPLVLPATPELLGCGATGGDWSPYAGDWTGYLVIEGGASSAKLTYWSRDAAGIPFVVAVDGATTTHRVGTSTVLTFRDVQMVAKKDQFPLVIIRPCATFSITATPQ